MLPAVILVVGHRLDEELIVLANIVRQDQERFCKKMFKNYMMFENTLSYFSRTKYCYKNYANVQ